MIFTFFSKSTICWEVPIKHSKAPVKQVSIMRWSAHYAAVKVLTENSDDVTAIEELCD